MFNLNEGLLAYIGVPMYVHFICLFFVLLSAYLLGSINSAILISKVIYKDDIRKYGSGNGGMTNMLRTFGGKAALMTFFGDLAKTVIAIVIAGFVFGFGYYGGISVNGYCYFAGLFAVLGHIFPVYYKFKGGKGVLVTSAMALILTPIPFLALLTIFIVVVAISKYVSLGSVTAAILYPVIANAYINIFLSYKAPGVLSICTVLLAIFIVWLHRGNLQRISERTERKISFKKKSKEPAEDAKTETSEPSSDGE